jgi:ribosomal protein L20
MLSQMAILDPAGFSQVVAAVGTAVKKAA